MHTCTYAADIFLIQHLNSARKLWFSSRAKCIKNHGVANGNNNQQPTPTENSVKMKNEDIYFKYFLCVSNEMPNMKIEN